MTTRGVEVTKALRDGILGGQYPGGMRLNEIEVAASLGVSRTPLRSALSTLAAEGLLDYVPNAGYVVRRIGASDIADVYAVRCQLEGLATRLAAERGLDPADLDTLGAVLAEGEVLVRAARWDDEVRERWSALDQRFHEIIYAASGNPALVDMLRRATDVPILAHLRFISTDFAFVERAQRDHVEIEAAVRQGEAHRAGLIAIEHVYRSGRKLTEQVRRFELREGGTVAARRSPWPAAVR